MERRWSRAHTAVMPLLTILLSACGGDEPRKGAESGPAVALSWNVLSSFEYTPRMTFPEPVAALSGRRGTVRGYVYPTMESRGIREFILMKDPGTCCYGPQTQYTHFMWVRVTAGSGINYTRDPVEATGTFRLAERFDGDYVIGIYELDADSVRRIE